MNNQDQNSSSAGQPSGSAPNSGPANAPSPSASAAENKLAAIEAALAAANGTGMDDHQRGCKRVRLLYVTLSCLSLTMMFFLILSGAAKAYILASPVQMSGDSTWEFIANWWVVIEPLHRYGGYGLMALMGGAGLAAWQLAKRLNLGAVSSVYRVLGIATVFMALAGPPIAAITGHRALSISQQAIDAIAESHKTEEGKTFAPATPAAFIEEEKAVESHVRTSSYPLGAGCLLLLVGGVLASSRRVKEASGIKV